jgi:hypothetical protein
LISHAGEDDVDLHSRWIGHCDVAFEREDFVFDKGGRDVMGEDYVLEGGIVRN